MTNTLLTSIETPGTVIVPHNYAQRAQLAIHIQALIAAGHAVQCDEVYEPETRPDRDTHGELRITHFRSCEKCKKSVL